VSRCANKFMAIADRNQNWNVTMAASTSVLEANPWNINNAIKPDIHHSANINVQ